MKQIKRINDITGCDRNKVPTAICKARAMDELCERKKHLERAQSQH